MASSMEEGETTNHSFVWNPSPSDDVSKSRVVAFIQNINTGQIYQSGYFDLSNITSIPSNERLFDVNLYPNPTTETLWFKSSVPIEQITITDLTGRLMSIKKPNSKQFNVSLMGYSSGVYLVMIKTNKGEIVRKIVKQ
jgi:hypothetical protein